MNNVPLHYTSCNTNEVIKSHSFHVFRCVASLSLSLSLHVDEIELSDLVYGESKLVQMFMVTCAYISITHGI